MAPPGAIGWLKRGVVIQVICRRRKGSCRVAPTGLEPRSSYNARRVNAYWNGMQVCDGLHSIQAGSEWLMRDISEEEMSRNLLQTVLSICISVSVGAKSD